MLKIPISYMLTPLSHVYGDSHVVDIEIYTNSDNVCSNIGVLIIPVTISMAFLTRIRSCSVVVNGHGDLYGDYIIISYVF